MKFTGERYIPDDSKFSEIAVEHMSRYIAIKEIVKDKVVLDAASGEGYGSFLISETAKKVFGVDISLEAILSAQETYVSENLQYIHSDIQEIPFENNTFDVIVSYETIEHVDEEIQKKFLMEIKRLLKPEGILIISTPDKDVYNKFVQGYHNEFHVKEFRKKEFKDFLKLYFTNCNFFDQNFQIVNIITDNNCEKFDYLKLTPSILIKGKYLIAICSDLSVEHININAVMQNSISSYNEKIDRILNLQKQIEEASDHIKKMYGDIIERDNIIENERLKFEELTSDIEKMNKEILDRDETIYISNDKINEVSFWAQNLNSEKSSLIKDNSDFAMRISKLTLELLTNSDTLLQQSKEIRELKEKNENLAEEKQKEKDVMLMKMDSLKKENFEIKNRKSLKNKAVEDLNKKLMDKHDELMRLSDWGKYNHEKLEKVIEDYSLLSHEMNLIKTSDFWKWANRYYKVRDNVWPFSWIFRKIKSKNLKNRKTFGEVKKKSSNIIIDGDKVDEPIRNNILYFSIIDYDFRTQRPQHLANNLSELGYNIHFFNANFLSNFEFQIEGVTSSISILKLKNNEEQRIYDLNRNSNLDCLYNQIKKYLLESDIKDGVIICSYPNWYPILEKINFEFGFEIIFDFLDDFAGFNTNIADLGYYTDRMFQISKKVISTSEFLYDKAKNFNDDVEMVRNGTEFSFFYSLENTKSGEKPIIGYYGAIAEWFDVDILCNIAKNRPNYNIVLIGDYSYANVSELMGYENVKFLGEMDYSKLPNWLEKFDVCLIPFDASTDLIKATNPVKFYEYLSAGKNIVATEIPELMPYRDKFAFLTNDCNQFLKYVDLCVEDKDALGSFEEKTNFARLQDWSERAWQINNLIGKMFDKISIVVVTFNNRHITEECINSILLKTKYPNYEIIIVDNLSTDSTREYLQDLRRKYENVKIILNDENYGFAKGNNIGLKIAEGEFLVLLNNDTVVTNGWLSSFVKHMKNNPDLGMIGPVTNSIGNEAQININYKNIGDMDFEAKKYTDEHFNELYRDINVLAMFCVIMKKEFFNKAGYLDEIYGIGMFEDDDYSNTIKELGYDVACAEDVFIHHYGSVSFKKLEDEKYRKIFEENKLKYEEKWGKKWVPHKYREGVR